MSVTTVAAEAGAAKGASFHSPGRGAFLAALRHEFRGRLSAGG